MMLGASAKAYVCVEPVDMRRSIDGLSALVGPLLEANALDGAVYVFFGKRRDKVKLLWFDRHGFWLAYKRLERGRFPRPQLLARRGLSMTELMALLDGVDLTRVRQLAPVSASRVR